MRTSFLFLLTFSGALFGAPSRQNLAIQEFRLTLDQMGYKLHGQQVEIDLFQERIQKLESAVEKLGQNVSKQKGAASPLETRLARLEKANQTLASDFTSLKKHLNETNSALAACQSKLKQLDQLKKSLDSMLALLQMEEQTHYIVKPGDSLGKIALDHKIGVKTLKKANNLTSDTIIVGQKLIIPK